MTSLFEHTDHDGDSFDVRTYGTNELKFTVDYPSAYLDAQTVRNLRDALTTWLGETIETISAPATPDAELIERIVSQAVTETTARLVQTPSAPWRIVVTGPEEDPEPHEAGHPDDPVIPLQGYCTCGHTKWAHEDVCYGPECTCKLTRAQVRGYETVPVSLPRLMTEVRKRSACTSCRQVHEGYHVRPLCGCGHCSRQHAGAYGSGECGVAGCTCERYGS